MLKIIDHDSVREVRLARPPVNALNPGLVSGLTAAIRDGARECDALVISGREGLFSAGLDVPELLQLQRPAMADFWRQFFALLEAVASSPVPVAAAITGHSPAGGAVLSLFCDYRVMANGDFKIGLNETRVGLLVPQVIRKALVRLTGEHRAERLIVAGTLLDPEDALQAGMVDALASDPLAAISDAVDWCKQHLALPREAMLGNREQSRRCLRAQFKALGDADVDYFVEGWFRESTQETLRSLVAQLRKK